MAKTKIVVNHKGFGNLDKKPTIIETQTRALDHLEAQKKFRGQVVKSKKVYNRKKVAKNHENF